MLDRRYCSPRSRCASSRNVNTSLSTSTSAHCGSCRRSTRRTYCARTVPLKAPRRRPAWRRSRWWRTPWPASGIEDRLVFHLCARVRAISPGCLWWSSMTWREPTFGSVKVVPHVLGSMAVREAVALTDADTLQAQRMPERFRGVARDRVGSQPGRRARWWWRDHGSGAARRAVSPRAGGIRDHDGRPGLAHTGRGGRPRGGWLTTAGRPGGDRLPDVRLMAQPQNVATIFPVPGCPGDGE
jgi:hypothetical protein